MRFLAALCALTFIVFASVALPSIALAESIEFELDEKFTGGAPVPELTITFADSGVDCVLITMTGTSLAGNEYIQDWYFNYNGNANTELTFSDSDTSDVTDFANISLTQSTAQDLQADGDGKYNIWLAFQSSGGDGQFTNDETVVIKVAGSGVTASDFNLLGLKGGGHGPYYSAAQIGGGTGWIADADGVPEPGTVILFGLGALGLAIRRRASRS